MSDLILNEPQYKTRFLLRALYNQKRGVFMTAKISKDIQQSWDYT